MLSPRTETVAPKADFEAIKKRHRDFRRAEQIQEHYLLEVALADRLRYAQPNERLVLYGKVYDELFARLPHHPQLTRETDDSAYAEKQVRILRRLVSSGSRYVEIGAGDGRVAMALSDLCSEVVAVDVTNKVLSSQTIPANFRFLLTDGIRFSLADGSADFVYSNQLMEHLHPADAIDQLKEIYRILAPGGVYFCITPNRLRGPHDVSRYFDDEARGLHLKEYTTAELEAELRTVGFSNVRSVLARGGVYLGTVPTLVVRAIEAVLSSCPATARRRLADSKPMRVLLGVAALARKT